jgi:hypothetical protein
VSCGGPGAFQGRRASTCLCARLAANRGRQRKNSGSHGFLFILHSKKGGHSGGPLMPMLSGLPCELVHWAWRNGLRDDHCELRSAFLLSVTLPIVLAVSRSWLSTIMLVCRPRCVHTRMRSVRRYNAGGAYPRTAGPDDVQFEIDRAVLGLSSQPEENCFAGIA